MQVYLSVTDILCGLRLDTGVRNRTLTNAAKIDQEFAFPDLGTASEVLMYSSVSGYPISDLNYLVFLVDPANVYADNATTPPTITVKVTTSLSDGTAQSTVTFDVRREIPLLLSGRMRTALATSSRDRKIYAVSAQSNMSSGYGTIMGRLIAQ